MIPTRANSTLKLVKGNLRITMTTERLSGLAMLIKRACVGSVSVCFRRKRDGIWPRKKWNERRKSHFLRGLVSLTLVLLLCSEHRLMMNIHYEKPVCYDPMVQLFAKRFPLNNASCIYSVMWLSISLSVINRSDFTFLRVHSTLSAIFVALVPFLLGTKND